MKVESLDNYKDIKKFVTEQNLNLEDDSHLSQAISNKFKILEFINYFLEKSKSLKGSDKLTKKLLQVGLKGYEKSTSNDYKDWYTLLSELEAFYLLSNKFGLNVVGYEQAPAGISKPPDFEIKLGNESVYFEVKFKASQVIQRIPLKFDEFLHSSPCKVSIIASTEAIDIHFSITSKLANSAKRLPGFRPDEIDDIESWLFKEKESKTPMVKEAESKGANYLVCFFPFWRNSDETFDDYIKPLFSDIQLLKPTFAVSKDRNIGQLSGIILLSQKGSLTNNYVIIANANVTPKINAWLC